MTAAVAVAVALCLALPMLAPARELASLSVRSKPDFAMIAEGGLHPRQLLGVVLPAMNEHTYAGLFALSLGLWSLRRGSSYPAAWLFAGVGVAGLLLMLGDHTPLFGLVYAVVPGASTFRDPARFSALWGTSTLVLAAAGLDAMLTTPPPDTVRLKWARAGGMVALACILVGEVPALDPHTHGEGLVLAGLCLAIGVVALMLGRGARMAGIVAGAMCVVDLMAYLPEGRHTREGPFPFPEGEATFAALRGVAGDLQGYRTWDEFGIHMRSGSRYGLRDFRGYQDPLSLGRYSKVIGELEKAPLLLGSFNVRWVLWAPHYLHGEGHHFLADPAKGTWAVRRAERVWEIPTALPMAYWMDRAEVASDADAALERVAAIAPAPVVVLEASAGVEGVEGTGAYAAAEKVTRRAEGLTVEVEAPAAGFVVVNEAWYPGWEAWVDGRVERIVRANALVMAVRVPAGAHRIEMAFRPWQPRVFEPLAVAAMTAVAVMGVRRRRRTKAVPSAMLG